MKTQPMAIIGIDISKAILDVCLLDAATKKAVSHYQVDNNPNGFDDLNVWVKRQNYTVDLFVFEATGRYHKPLENWLFINQEAWVKLNPARARYFANACGVGAKTDKIDARMLAQMALNLDLKPQMIESPSAWQALEKVKNLWVAYLALKKDLRAVENRREDTGLSLLKRHNDQQIVQIKRHIKHVVDQIQELIQSNELLCRKAETMQSMMGIGFVSSIALIAELPELGKIQNRQVAALVGVAPYDRQSGTTTRRSKTGGGRKRLRTALYMPALVAIRHNPELKERYEHLLESGKEKKVAIIAVMRKMVLTLNALIRDNRMYNEIST